MSDLVTLSLAEVQALSLKVLTRHGLSDAHARAIAEVITQGQRDECHSHGVYRLLGCVRSVREGKVDPLAEPSLRPISAGVLEVDAHYGYSLLAFQTGLPLLAEKARSQGLAAMAIKRCFHFSALWPEVEAIAAEGLVGIAMNPSHSWVAPAGGSKPVFGTNPWPSPGHGRRASRSCSTSPAAPSPAAISNCTRAKAKPSPNIGPSTPRASPPRTPRRPCKAPCKPSAGTRGQPWRR